MNCKLCDRSDAMVKCRCGYHCGQCQYWHDCRYPTGNELPAALADSHALSKVKWPANWGVTSGPIYNGPES